LKFLAVIDDAKEEKYKQKKTCATTTTTTVAAATIAWNVSYLRQGCGNRKVTLDNQLEAISAENSFCIFLFQTTIDRKNTREVETSGCSL
jgi:hypothetical protein